MQNLANRLEAMLLEQQAAIETFNEAPTAIFVNTSTIGPVSSAGSAQFSFPNADAIFSNYTGAAITSSTGSLATSTFKQSGLYHLGWFVNCTEVGAITNDSFRQVACSIRNNAGVGSTVDILHRRVTSENLAGGNFFGNNLVFSIGEDFALHGVLFEFSHGNIASDMQITAGNARAWITRIGSRETIEVS